MKANWSKITISSQEILQKLKNNTEKKKNSYNHTNIILRVFEKLMSSEVTISHREVYSIVLRKTTPPDCSINS